MADGRRPLGTGLFFALGHSTIIVVVGLGLAAAARAVFGAVVNPSSGYETIGGVIGTSMAASFLCLIAALNRRAGRDHQGVPAAIGPALAAQPPAGEIT